MKKTWINPECVNLDVEATAYDRKGDTVDGTWVSSDGHQEIELDGTQGSGTVTR